MARKANALYPRSDRQYGERPIRIIDANTQKCVPHRCYKHRNRAMNAAAAFVANWAPVGTVFEVYNSQSGRLYATYERPAAGTVRLWIDPTKDRYG